MNITRENIDSLNAVLKIEVARDDYLPAVDEAVKKYRKNVNMKGFRQGMVPASLVKKMYGNSILVEELNRLVSEQINEHIREENLEILGQPLPKADAALNLDIQHPEDLTLEYELGLVPRFDLSPVSKDAVFHHYKIRVDDVLLDEELDHLLLRHGNMAYPEDAEVMEKDVLHMEISELENGEPKEGGVVHKSPIGLNIFKESEQSRFLGMKPGDAVDVKLFDIAERDRDSVLKFVLGLKEEIPEDLGEDFRMKLDKIGRMEKSELNQEFFDKVYGQGVVDSEEAFRDRMRSDLAAHFERETEIRLKNDLTTFLLEKIDMDFPDDFLKRWIRVSNEKPITEEEVEADYENFTKGLKWNLISNKLGSENDIKAEKEEIEAFSREQLRKQLEMYNPGGNPISDEDLDTFNASMMAREDHVKKTYEAVMEQKLFDFLEQAVTIEEKEVSLEDFRDLAAAD
jgi:trigger factor